jgi:hypothetical protein
MGQSAGLAGQAKYSEALNCRRERRWLLCCFEPGFVGKM